MPEVQTQANPAPAGLFEPAASYMLGLRTFETLRQLQLEWLRAWFGVVSGLVPMAARAALGTVEAASAEAASAAVADIKPVDPVA